jgi:hypothetical protein
VWKQEVCEDIKGSPEGERSHEGECVRKEVKGLRNILFHE